MPTTTTLISCTSGYIYLAFLAGTLVPEFWASLQWSKLRPLDRNLDSPVVRVVLNWSIFHIVLGVIVYSFVRMILSPADEELKWIRQDTWREPDVFGRLDKEEDIAWLKTLMSDQNKTVLSSVEVKKLRGIRVVERKQTHLLESRFCQKCNVFKPDRSHHCSRCKKCVLRMDHHCPWVDNCIGFRNYKFFWCVLLWTPVATCFVLWLMHPRFLKTLHYWDPAKFFFLDLHIFMAYIIAGFIFCLMLAFWMFHVYLVSSCLTTIEWKEKKSAGGVLPMITDVLKRHRWSISNAKYNEGWYRNLCNVLGPPWMWMLPIHPGGDGTYLTFSPETSSETSSETSETLDP